LTGFELLTEMYNEPDLLYYFTAALAGDITRITLEPFFQITTATQYYFIVDKADGDIKMITSVPSGTQFQLSSVNVTGIASGSFIADAPDNTHLLIGSTKVITTTDTTANSFKVNSSGGINLIAALGVTINGDLTVAGTTTTVNTTDLDITDNVITLNAGETGAGISHVSGQAGVIVDRGTENDYNIIFDEADDTFKAGEVGSEQAVATREATPVDGQGVLWNSTTNRFESTNGLSPSTPATEFEYDSQTDFDWSVRDTGTAPASGFALGDMINNNRQDLYELIELLSTEGASYLIAAGASLIGCDGIPDITPTGKTAGETGNLQQILEGVKNYINARITKQATFPTTPLLGDECYRTDSDQWYKYNGSTWTQI
jgi:hypothetical protein